MIELKDADGRSFSMYSGDVAILSDSKVIPLSGQLILDKTQMNLGDTVTARWEMSGGKAPYDVDYWNWTLRSAGSQVDGGISGSMKSEEYSFTPALGDSCQFMIELKDADGRSFSMYSGDVAILQSEGIPKPTKTGDANNDGAIDIMDLVSIIDYIVSDTPSSSMANADANGDGLVDIMDLVWIIDVIVGG